MFNIQKGSPKTALVIVDPQVDFHEGGSLGVNGANDDSERIANLIKGCIDDIHEIVVTLDTHHRMHISHGEYWKDRSGNALDGFTPISLKDVQDGKYSPVDENNQEHVKWYLEKLEKQGNFAHIIWPEHCLIGTEGHAIVEVLNEALQEWTKATLRPITYLNKGMNTQTEMYSPFKAEVVIEDDPKTDWNREVLDHLKSFERVLVCGQARSHCVNHATRDMATYFGDDQCSKLVILTDGCSNVNGFEGEGTKFFEDMSAKGVNLVTVQQAQDNRSNGWIS